MIKNFEFYNPTRIIFGKNTIAQLGSILQKHQLKNALLLAGGGSIKQNGVYDSVTNALRKAGIRWMEQWGVRPNPVLSTVEDAVRLARQSQVDSIIAVGGGSVIDSAKAIAAGFYMDDIWAAYARRAAIEKALPLFVVLTISATGSEMNGFSVITKEDEKKKWATGSPALYPKVSIIDPRVQSSLPWSQTVNGGIDALAHVMEFYFLGTTEETTVALDEALQRTIIKMANQLQQNQNDYDSRLNLAYAATLALNGLSGAQLMGGDWATHMIEHGLSALHPEVAHGTGLGILFPAWIRHMEPHNPPQFKRWAQQVWQAGSIEKGIASMKETLKQWGAPVSLRELGVAESELEAITDNTLLAAPIGVLKRLTKEDVMSILRLAY